MAGWYVRRDEKVVGPVDLAKLRESVATGMLLPTDQLAKDAAGPWTEASRTILFAKKPTEPSSLEPTPQALVPKVEYLPVRDQPIQDQPASSNKLATIVQTTNVFIAAIGRGTLTVSSAVVRSLSTRAQRRHELKLAKIQSQALADSQQPQARATPTGSIMFAPQMAQTTVVKIVNRNRGGCGCSGCGLILLLILLAVLAAGVYSNMHPSNPQHLESGPIQPASTGKKWYEGGTLHGAKISEWRNASYENRLATCSDFVMTMRGNGVVPADLPVDEYKPYAVDLERGISIVASGGNVDSQSVAEIAAVIRVLEEKN